MGMVMDWRPVAHRPESIFSFHSRNNLFPLTMVATEIMVAMVLFKQLKRLKLSESQVTHKHWSQAFRYNTNKYMYEIIHYFIIQQPIIILIKYLTSLNVCVFVLLFIHKRKIQECWLF